MIHAFEKGFEDDAFGRVGNVFHRGDHLHAVVFERFLVDRRFVFVPGKPVELVNENEIPLFLRAVFDHTPEIRAVVVGPRHRTVDVSIYDEDIVRFCIVLANAKLPFDGLFVLFVAGISRINRC